MTTRDREVGHHFTERNHDSVTDGSDNGVTEQQTEGTTVLESAGGTQEEACANDTTDLFQQGDLLK